MRDMKQKVDEKMKKLIKNAALNAGTQAIDEIFCRIWVYST